MEDELAKTEEALIVALRAYIEARSTGEPVDDITDDAVGAVNQALQENWNIDPNPEAQA
jgi:hypothetical protein